MALEGELDIVKVCPDCGLEMPVKVCSSGAGYYIGQFCNQCGPWNRLSLKYYKTWTEADTLLKSGEWQKRDTEYHPGPMKIVKLNKKGEVK